MDTRFVERLERAIARGLERVPDEDVAPDYAERALMQRASPRG